MKKLTLLTLAVAGVLAGCGGGSESSNNTATTPVNPPEETTNGERAPLIKAWSGDTVVTKMSTASTTQTENANLCQTRTTGAVVETADFRVTFGQNNTHKNMEELNQVARLAQVALDELIAHTGLSKATDLKITASNKWTVCYNDDKTGNGSGFTRSFEFSPKTLNPADTVDFTEGYQLAKHELFHVIQDSLLGENTVYLHLPRWFQEASAELFAGKDTSGVTAGLLTEYLADTRQTPLAVTTWNDEQNITAATAGKYENHMYRMYLISLEYLYEKGMTSEQLLQLTRDAYTAPGNTGFTAFDTAMATLENSLQLPATFTSLKQNTADYQAHIIGGWLGSENYSAGYTDDIASPMKELYVFTSDGNKELTTGWINQAQDSYTFNKPLQDGAYLIYAGTAADVIYGPITKTVKNGELGDIDFSGVAICTDCND